MQDDAGFTLLEALIALTVLAMMSASLISAGTSHVQRISGIEDRAFAGLIAEARLQEIVLDPARRVDLPTTLTSVGQSWRITVDTVSTDEPELLQVIVSVRPGSVGGSFGPVAQRIGFADLGAGS